MTNDSYLFLNKKGWLNLALHLPSPHQDKRPDKQTGAISLLVLHNISLPPNQWGENYINHLFLGTLPLHQKDHPYFTEIANLKVSTHFYIARNGMITQFVSTLKRAWHAGISCYGDRERCNDFSIGIELNGSDHFPYTQRQYFALAELCQAIIKRHPKITPKRITTHSAISPQRKTDPGPAFKQLYFEQLLQRTQKETSR